MTARAVFELDLAGPATARAAQRVTGDLGSAFDWDAIRPEDHDADAVLRARVGWTVAAFNEYCTAAAMGQLVHALCAAGAPLDLLALASSFAVEEVVHVELCSRVAMRLGGGVPIAYDPDDLTCPFPPGTTPMQRAHELVVRVCCVGEEFSLPMLTATLQATTHPVLRAVWRRIVGAEAQHGHLGWSWLDWAAPSLDDADRERLGRVASDAIRHLAPAWRDLRPDGPRDHGALGFMDAVDQAPLARRAMEDVIARLARHGLRVDPDLTVP